jgi:hypothetical protein
MRRAERPGPGQQSADEPKKEEPEKELVKNHTELAEPDSVTKEGSVIVDENGQATEWQGVVLRPYPNEHSCRLSEPDSSKKHRRVNCAQKHDGKCIDVIYEISGPGKSKIQALRFKTSVWNAAAARAVCRDRDGTFEAAKRQVTLSKAVKLSKPIPLKKREENIDHEKLAAEMAMRKIKGRMT